MGRFARDVEAFYGGIRNGRFPRYLQYIRKETGIGDRGGRGAKGVSVRCNEWRTVALYSDSLISTLYLYAQVTQSDVSSAFPCPASHEFAYLIGPGCTRLHVLHKEQIALRMRAFWSRMVCWGRSSAII